MLLNLPELVEKHAMAVTGVVHCGANLGQEAPDYARYGWPTWWIEAEPEIIERLTAFVTPYGHHVIKAALYKEDDQLVCLHVSNYDSLCSSLLPFGTHRDFSPDAVFLRDEWLPSFRLDTLAAEHGIECNFLVMDLQGAELWCLEGATKFLPSVDYVLTEINTAEVYQGCTRLEELDAFLEGFDRVETYHVPGQGWGDALYVRRS